jgi:hypothetical protein
VKYKTRKKEIIFIIFLLLTSFFEKSQNTKKNENIKNLKGRQVSEMQKKRN